MTDEPTTPSAPDLEEPSPEADDTGRPAGATTPDLPSEPASDDGAVTAKPRGLSPRGSRQSRRRAPTGAAGATAVAEPGTRDAPRPRRRLTVAEVLADVPEDAVIVARRLTKQYGDFTAVERLDLTIPRGGGLGPPGPHGARKTTPGPLLL